ncbi:MAG: hypothetical protein AAGJ46_05825 [Planctomycetota bacterium]
MTRRNSRRLSNAISLAIGVVCVWWLVRTLDHSLARTTHLTGYAMMAVVVVLAGYNGRKKLASLPLGSSAAWLQLHVYLGLGSAVLLLIHTSGRWPNGWLEGVLAAAYWATFASGVLGLYLTRAIPRQLARTSEEFVYERIPQHRREVVEKCRAAVLEAVGDGGATTLADFYTGRLDAYLAEPRGVLHALRPTSRLRRALMQELTDLRRFCDPAERVASERLFALVRKKDDLDFHQARQGLLKRWVFVHIALTWLLLTTAALHGWMAWWMRGGPG